MKSMFLFALVCATIAAAGEAKLHLQLGHSDRVTTVVTSRDGRYALTGSDDRTARLWNVVNGREVRIFEGNSQAINSVAFSSSSSLVLTGSRDGAVKVWDIVTGKEVQGFKTRAPVASVAFSSDDRFVLTTSGDYRAEVWDRATGRLLRRYEGHGLPLAFSPDGRYLLTSLDGKNAQIWNVATGREIRRFGFNSGAAVVISPDSRLALILIGEELRVRLWDLTAGRELHRLDKLEGLFRTAAFSQDNRYFLLGDENGFVSLWDVSNGQQVRKFGEGLQVDAATFSQDGKYVLASGNAGTVNRWEVSTGREMPALTGPADPIDFTAFLSNGAAIVTKSKALSQAGASLHLWNIAKGTETTRRIDQSTGDDILFSPDRQSALTVRHDKPSLFWNVTDGRELDPLAWSGTAAPIAVSSDRRFVITVPPERHSASLSELATGRLISRIEGDSAFTAQFSRDSQKVLLLRPIFGGKTDVTVLATSGQRINHLILGLEESITLSPDGLSLMGLTSSREVSSSSAWVRDVVLCEIASGHETRRLEAQHINSVVFSPDGRSALVSFDEGEGLSILDLASGHEIRRFKGRSNGTTRAEYSPDGKVIVANFEFTTELWSVSTGQLLARLVSFRKGGWTVVDSAGRFDSSDPNNSPGLHFVAGLDVIELSQLKQRFYTPGLLARIWRGEKLPEIGADLKDVKTWAATNLLASVSVHALRLIGHY